ncbi:MAG: hypothetical protein HKN67_13400 [Saprospiraceae bacterium]|nr:hypothetical protein [Saprospiraceae bacterium]
MASKRNKKDLRKKKKISPQKQRKLEKQRKVESPSGFNKVQWMLLAFVLLLTFIAFIPSLNNEFVNWDDDRNIYENELITTLNDQNFWSNVKEIFTTDVIGGYNPLTIFTFALEQRFFGIDNPFYWHLDNLILHLLCTLLVFCIGYRLKLGYIGSTLLALLFGLHPMRVESVAWVTERKDVLFGVFYLLAMYYYIKGKQGGFKKKYYLIIAISFALSLLSKIQAVIFPISIILIDYYLSKSSTITLKSIIRKTPYFLGSLIVGLLGIYFLKDQGSIDQQAYQGGSRLFIGSYSLFVYYVKSLFPYELSPLYPYPSSIDWKFYVSIISFAVTGLLLWFSYFKKWKVIFFGLAFFFANVVLLLQILGAGQGFLADRFTYIPYFGLFFIFSYYIEQFIKKKANYKTPVLAVSGLVILAYSFMTFNQSKIWKNGGTLWTHVLKYYDKTTLPFGNRANYYRDNGNINQALRDYSSVIRLNANKPEPYNSRARLYFNYNHPDSLRKALFNYNKAIELKPNDVEYIVNRGATYAKLNNLNKSLENLNHAETIDPNFANIYLNRSVIFSSTGQYELALKDIDKYIQLKPAFPDMWYEKCRLANALGRAQEGLDAINRALSMEQKGMYFFERAKSYFMLNNFPAAKQDLATSQRMGHQGDPNVVSQIINS